MLGTVELRGVRVLSAEISPLAVSVLSVGNGKSNVVPSWSVPTCGMTPPPRNIAGGGPLGPREMFCSVGSAPSVGPVFLLLQSRRAFEFTTKTMRT